MSSRRPRLTRTDVSVQRVEAGEVYVRVSTIGTNGVRPFVLVPGLGVSSNYFERLAPNLNEFGPVHALDLPGFGGVPHPASRLGIRGYADLVGQVIDDLELEDPIVVGHSMGTQIVTDLAARRPELSTLVLIGPVVNADERRLLIQARRFVQCAIREPGRVKALALSSYVLCGVKWFSRMLPEMLHYRIEDQLPHVRASTLVIRGQHDFIASAAWVERIADLLPRARAYEIPNAAHSVMHAHAEAVAELCVEHARRPARDGVDVDLIAEGKTDQAEALEARGQARDAAVDAAVDAAADAADPPMTGPTISVLICSMPAEGHVRPMLAVAQVLVARGWRVRFLTGAAYAAVVSATGASFLPLPPDADRLDQLEHDGGAKGLRAINEGVARAFFDPARAAWAGIQAALAAEPVDAVLHETTFVGAAGLTSIPVEHRPLTVMCGILPLGISSRDTAPFGLGLAPMTGPLRALGPLRNRLLTTMATRVLLRPVHQQADAVLAALGAPPLDGRFFVDLLADEDVLAQFTVAEFEYPRSDAPVALHFFGPTSRLTPSESALPPWWDRLDASRPVVHVSQGTVANADFTELVLPTLEALAAEEVTVVAATGGRPVSSLGPLPANALAAEFIPYDRLLPRTDVFVTNGGYGGLHYAMEHGVPVVVAGDTEDKVETSARVAWSGIGLNLKTGRPSTAALAKAVRTVLTDPRYARRSAEIGVAITSSPGVEGLAALLETMIIERRVGRVEDDLR